MLNLRHVQAFSVIVRLGSFHAAARALATTQPSISAWIRNLERDLGVRLFDTTSRRAVLTQKGREFVAHAERMLAVVDEIYGKMGNPEAVSGVMRLGATETTAMTWLPDLVEKVKRRYPDVLLELDIDLPTDLWAKFQEGVLDILIVPGPILQRNIFCRWLGSCQYRWMASPQLDLPRQRLTAKQLADYPIISLSASSALYHYADRWFRENDANPNWVNHCSSLGVVANLTRSGFGVSLLLPSVMEEDLAAGRLEVLEVAPPFPALDVYTVYAENALSPTLSAIVELISHVSTYDASDASGGPEPRGA